MSEFRTATTDEPFSAIAGPNYRRRTPDELLEGWANPQGIPGDLLLALKSVESVTAGDPRDWAHDRRDAWLYGIVHGWECGDPKCDHTDPDWCEDALPEVAERHGWTEEDVARLTRYRKGWKEATDV